MRRKIPSKKNDIKCIVILSSCEKDDWDKAKKKEDKQLSYINTYAKKHHLIPMEIVRRGCFGPMEMNRILHNVIKKMDSGKAEAILVANALSISSSISDAYLKVGKVVQAGYRFISVDEGELYFKLFNPEVGKVVENGN